jgi:outer membrane lipoprotein
MRMIFILFLLLLASACTSIISMNTMSEADKSISFAALQQNPDVYKGKTVIFGGQIIATIVKVDETWIEVLQKPLDYRQKPVNTDQTSGRFLVRFPGFIYPSIYANGRKLTVKEIVEGRIIRQLKGNNYSYPVFVAKEHRLWIPVETYSFPRFGVGIGLGEGSYGGGVGVWF